jgi:hypothetical protein
MLNLRRRLAKLERRALSREREPPRDPIVAFALRELSDEDLNLLLAVGSDEASGVYRVISKVESAAVAAYEAAIAKMQLSA